MPQPMKSTSRERWVWSFNPLNSVFMQNSICYTFAIKFEPFWSQEAMMNQWDYTFAIKFEPFWSQEAMMNQWDHSGTSNSGGIRLHASVS